jgi:hypothetical protein
MNIRAAQGIKCVQNVLVSNVPALFFLFPYTLLPSPWELTDGLTKSFSRDVMIALVDSSLYVVLACYLQNGSPHPNHF